MPFDKVASCNFLNCDSAKAKMSISNLQDCKPAFLGCFIRKSLYAILLYSILPLSQVRFFQSKKRMNQLARYQTCVFGLLYKEIALCKFPRWHSTILSPLILQKQKSHSSTCKIANLRFWAVLQGNLFLPFCKLAFYHFLKFDFAKAKIASINQQDCKPAFLGCFTRKSLYAILQSSILPLCKNRIHQLARLQTCVFELFYKEIC